MATESNVYGGWFAKQAGGKGVPATVAEKQPIMVGGDVALNVTHGSENWSDLDRFGDTTDFVDSISGGGSPVFEAQSEVVAHLLYLAFGSETFTAKAAGVSPPKYVFEPNVLAGFWQTFWKRVGMTSIVRQKFNDCRITGVRIEGSTANKVVKITPTYLSLDPGEIFTADPAKVKGTQEPFLYTEGAGRFSINGTVYRGHTQFAIFIDFAETGIPGDDVRFYDVVPGNARVTLEGVTLVLDGNSYGEYCKQIYGTATPANGTKPIAVMPSLGGYTVDLRKTLGPDGVALAADAVESLKIEVPQVHWTPDAAIAPNPDGGAIEIALAGEMRKNPAGGAPPIAPKLMRITVETGASTDVAHT